MSASEMEFDAAPTGARRQRRRLLGAALAGAALLPLRGVRADTRPTLTIGTTPVFLDDELSFLRHWQAYLEQALDRPVKFVQRGSYREVSELLLTEKLDAAWVCGFPYVRYRSRMRLLAVPTYQGEPLYRSYVIVPASDTTTRSIADLGGRIYAFSDPDSNSGWLVPNAQLHELGKTPAGFFRKTFFTWAHRRVVDAVASGVAQGGSVDGYVWDTLQLRHPELTARTRVAARSPLFGFPPLVTRKGLPDPEFQKLQDVLVAMASTDAGRPLLAQLNLDGFQRAPESVFDGISRNMHLLGLG